MIIFDCCPFALGKITGLGGHIIVRRLDREKRSLSLDKHKSVDFAFSMHARPVELIGS